MAKFGHVLISGIAWILICVLVAILGGRLGGALGTVLSWVGWLFAALAAWHLIRMTSLQIRGMRMAQQDPEGFARLREEYEDALRRVEEREGQE